MVDLVSAAGATVGILHGLWKVWRGRNKGAAVSASSLQSPTDGAPTPDGGSSCTTLAVYSGTAPKPSPKQPSVQRRLLRTLRRTASIPQATVKLLASTMLRTASTGVVSIGRFTLDVTPHFAGAVDVVAVRQADGTIKCTPFRARFGKYTARWSADKSVRTYVNGQEMPFTLHLSRDGDVFFMRNLENGEAVPNGSASFSDDGVLVPGAGVQRVLTAADAAQAVESPYNDQVVHGQAVCTAPLVRTCTKTNALRLRGPAASLLAGETTGVTLSFPTNEAINLQTTLPRRSWGCWLPIRRPSLRGEVQDCPGWHSTVKTASTPTITDYTCKKQLCVPTPQQLAAMQLRNGRNAVAFKAGRKMLHADIYVLPADARVVVSDVDGTVTKSDVPGQILPPAFGHPWSHVGVTRLYNTIKENGYELLYLSSRPIGMAGLTRWYINWLFVGGHSMPQGPVLVSSDGLLPALYRELIQRRPHVFKIRCLEEVRSLFPTGHNPFIAAFGNRHTDEIAYQTVGIHASRTYTINKKGTLRKLSDTAVARTLEQLMDSVDSFCPRYSPLRMLHDAGCHQAADDAILGEVLPTPFVDTARASTDNFRRNSDAESVVEGGDRRAALATRDTLTVDIALAIDDNTAALPSTTSCDEQIPAIHSPAPTDGASLPARVGNRAPASWLPDIACQKEVEPLAAPIAVKAAVLPRDHADP